MINAKEAKRMFRNTMKGCPRARDPENIMAHCECIADIVADVIRAIKIKIPEFMVDEKEMELAALLHDIGYCFAEEDMLHPIVGGDFLEERGLSRIARIVKGHTYAADVIRVTGYKGLDPKEYEAKTWNHVLIDYASLHCGKPGERISPDEKFKRFRAKRSERFLQVIDMAEPRLREEVNHVNSLLNGNKETLSKYRFL